MSGDGQTNAAPDEDGRGAGPIRIALVDDQELFREGIRVIIDAQPDMSVVGTAPDGAAGVELVDVAEPDVVLMDIRMPELDGVEATQRILRAERMARRSHLVRVVVLTTFDLDERAAVAIRAGASGFLLKEATPAQLVDAIRTVHAGNAVLAPRDLNILLDGRFREARPLPPSFTELTERERSVFDAVARGASNAEVGAALFMSESTVKTHVGTILRKLSLRDRVQVVVFAYEHGLM